MSELKKEVNTAAFAAMTAACSVIGNKDIEHMTPKIVRSISNPEEVPEIMHSLAGVTFVQSVQVRKFQVYYWGKHDRACLLVPSSCNGGAFADPWITVQAYGNEKAVCSHYR